MKTITKFLASKSEPSIPDSEVGEVPSQYNQTPISLCLDRSFDFGEDHFGVIYRALLKRPKKLILQIVPGADLSHEIALSCFYLLQKAKQKGLRVKTVAWGNLIDGCLLVFLCGEEREVGNPSAYFEIKSLKRLENVDWSDGFTGNRDYTQKPQFLELYKEVFRLLNAYLPALELSDKMVRLPVLAEYGLVDIEECPLNKFITR